MYDDLGLFQRFCFFGRREVLEEFDEFNDLQYLASTKGSSSALVTRPELSLLACVSLYFFRAFLFVCLFLHFMVYSVETVTEAF